MVIMSVHVCLFIRSCAEITLLREISLCNDKLQ